MIVLGNIIYSNCLPVHARLLDGELPDGIRLVDGVPSALNRKLERGEIDVAPASSIEYARHADRYRILPDLVIGSRGPVRSILLVSDHPPEELDGRTVALSTASATSVVLLKILLRQHWDVRCRFRPFDQSAEGPLTQGADAALYIGDEALRVDRLSPNRIRVDLGEAWWRATGLPFAFALWQTSGAPSNDRDAALHGLHEALLESRRWGSEHRAELVRRHAPRFGFDAASLADYWRDLRFELDEEMVEGLREFYRRAVQIGELPEVPRLRWLGW